MKEMPISNPFRSTVARINLDALRANFTLAVELVGPKVGLLGVVKANAYGHGAVPVARVLAELGAAALGVAIPEEGCELRKAGLTLPILVFGGPFHATGEELREQNLTPVIYNLQQVRELNASTRGVLPVHLKIDTGMTRLGILPEELPAMLAALNASPHLSLQGVLTHLARADEGLEGAALDQFQRFEKSIQILRRERPATKIFHIALSAAILGGHGADYDWARPGLMLYGANPNPRFEQGQKLQPVMSLETEILSLKEVPAGTEVSYGGSWVAKRRSRIAVLPIGYADGYIRHLSNIGEVLLHGKLAPVAGRVCMDLTMVDVTDIPEAKLGDKVLLWGPGLPAETAATKAGTIAYELFCSVSSRVPRIYEGASA